MSKPCDHGMCDSSNCPEVDKCDDEIFNGVTISPTEDEKYDDSDKAN